MPSSPRGRPITDASAPAPRFPGGRLYRAPLLAMFLALASLPPSRGSDWPQFGRDATRNPVSPETRPPLDWDVASGRHVRWKARLGSITVSSPVVSGGLVWVGTNNDPPRDPKRPGPRGILACFRESDGTFLYQHEAGSPASSGPLRRRSEFGMTGTPVADGDRLWFVSTTAEVVCLDTGPLRRQGRPPRIVWAVDLVRQFGIHPAVDIMGGRGLTSLSPPHENLLHVVTGNGTDWTQAQVPAPHAPALVALDRDTGVDIWSDRSPGTNLLVGEFGSPLVVEVGGVIQVVAPQGDGWVRAFEARTGALLWKFDINPKAVTRRSHRNFFVNSPVFHRNRVYVAGGRDVESGQGQGRLVCLDPTRRGDLSLELEDVPGKGRPNPDTGALWHFDGLGRTLSNVAIAGGMVVATDLGGSVYALREEDGRLLWRHEAKAWIWGSPLVVDGRIYVGNEDGRIDILALSHERRLLARREFPTPIYASPVFANGVLYVADSESLYALREPDPSLPRRHDGPPTP